MIILLIILMLLVNVKGTKAAATHRRYKEWITEGNVEIRDKLSINILSLEGLVDLAIDLDKRVIFDSGVNKYYVLAEDIVYVHDPDHTHSLLENKTQLGKLLLNRGIIIPEQLELGLYYQKKIGGRLGESLIALGFINETTLYSTLAAQQKVDYYELDPVNYSSDISWLDKMSIQKARALMSLPLGVRADGKLVVACSEASREGIKEALQEMFGTQVQITATRPSVIYEVLERLEDWEKEKQSIPTADSNNELVPVDRLTGKEREQFTAAYYRGIIQHELLLKAAGLVDSVTLSQIPEQEVMLSWLSNKNIISGEIANLIKGLDEAAEKMDFKARHEKQQPDFINLLLYAHYLTPETVEWVKREQILQGISASRTALYNYLASEETVRNAELLTDTLADILK